MLVYTYVLNTCLRSLIYSTIAASFDSNRPAVLSTTGYTRHSDVRGKHC